MKLQSLSIESVLNKKFIRPTKDMIRNPKRAVDYININAAELLQIDILPGNKWGVDATLLKDKLAKDGFPQLFSVIDRGLDECSVQTYYLYKQYFKGMKHYVPSNPLVDVLKSIDIDMKSSHLVSGTSGYFELSHTEIYPPSHWSVHPIQNFIFYVNDQSLMVTILFKDDLAPTSFYIPLNKEENLANVLSNLDFQVINRDRRLDGQLRIRRNIEEVDIDAIRLLFNLIIYVTNPNEEFRVEFNKFSPNQKVAQVEKQTYTTKGFIRLGHDAEFLRLVTTETYDVRGHWRWQPVGIGRLGRRLTFIRPHQRSQNKFLND